MIKAAQSEYRKSDDLYSPEEQKLQQVEIDRPEKERMIKEYYTPAAIEARDIKEHAETESDYIANKHRANTIAEATDKVNLAARTSDELFKRYDNVQAFEDEVKRLIRNERHRLEKLYPIREDKHRKVYFSFEATLFLMKAVLNGKTTSEAYELLQQDKVLSHDMDKIIKQHDYDLNVPNFIDKAKRRGSYHVKGVYDEIFEQYAYQQEDDKYRAKKFKRAATDATRTKWQPEMRGDLYDNIRLIDAASMWGKDYRQLYTSSDRGFEGCLAKLARALKLARLRANLKDSKQKINTSEKEIKDLTTELNATKAALAALQDNSNSEMPNHKAMIQKLYKDKNIHAATMLPILVKLGYYSGKDIKDKKTRNNLLANIRKVISRTKQPSENVTKCHDLT